MVMRKMISVMMMISIILGMMMIMITIILDMMITIILDMLMMMISIIIVRYGGLGVVELPNCNGTNLFSRPTSVFASSS